MAVDETPPQHLCRPCIASRTRLSLLGASSHSRWYCWLAALLCLSIGSVSCRADDSEAVTEALEVELSDLRNEHTALRAQLDEATDTAESAHAEATDLQSQLGEARAAAEDARSDAADLQERLDEADAEIYDLRVTYEEEIRATVQAEIDAEIARACAEATDDLEAPVAGLVRWESDWSPLIDETGLRSAVMDCATPAREQAKAAALAELQSQVDQERKRACEEASENWESSVRSAVRWNDDWSSLTNRSTLIVDVMTCATPARERAEANAEANRLASCETGAVDSIVKDPVGWSRSGDCVLVYAVVFQFDAVTGRCRFLANMRDRSSYRSWDYHDNVYIQAPSFTSCPELEDIDQDDFIRVWGTVAGAETYETRGGGTNTVPALTIEKIELRRKG